jgi:cytoplasmic iron level regulating protein YaaA (DUF328/UPF0246 family)
MAVDLDDERARVVRALARAMRGSTAARSALLGVSGDALAAATNADRSVTTGPTRHAIERYTGVLYEALDVAGLPAGARRRLPEAVMIFSGLWGLVAPGDPIPDYKLKMGASLPGLGRLSTWWRPAVSARLAEVASVRRMWNLLPKEHDAAWTAPSGLAQVSVEFLEPARRDGRLVAVAHWNKFLKGALVRHLLEHPRTTPRDLVDWRHPSGFRLDPARTTTDGERTTLRLVRS